MTKDFNEQLADLENGLNSILKTINKPTDLRKHHKAIEAKHIQDARIDFFKKGYNLRDKELKEQQKIKMVFICECKGKLKEVKIENKKLFYCEKCDLFFPEREETELKQKKLR